MTPNEDCYLFPQQEEDTSCHLYPAINLEILHRLRNKGYLTNPQRHKHLWHTYEQWMGKVFHAMVTWQNCFKWLIESQKSEFKHFREAQFALAEHGLHLDQMYTKSGKAFIQATLNPIEKLKRFWLTPYNFVNAKKHPDALLKTLPIVFDGHTEYMYCYQKNAYHPLPLATEKAIQNQDPFILFLQGSQQYYQLTQPQFDFLRIPRKARLTVIELELEHSPYKLAYGFQFLPKEANKQVYFHVGLFQLMLLAMGIDNNNALICKGHPRYLEYRQFKSAIQASPKNPWNNPYFHRHYFFEYHLASVFLENPTLFEEAAKTHQCSFNSWAYYLKLDTLYDSPSRKNRTSLKYKKSLLPCKALILAYSFSQQLRLAWASALGKESLHNVLEIPKKIKPWVNLLNLASSSKINKSFYRTFKIHGQKTSFIETWQKLKPLVLTKANIEDFISFNGHSVVMSFAKDTKNLAKKALLTEHQNKVHLQLLRDLDFTLIDSLYAETHKPFYCLPASELGCKKKISAVNFASNNGIATE